jgi:RNA polymerase sigma-70 factor (ECF subfamily)
MDADTFQTLYKGHYLAVRNYIFSLTKDMSEAESITHEAFLQYEKKRVSFRGECSEYTMICHIGKNIWLNQLRRYKKVQYLGEEELPEHNAISFEEQIIDKDVALEIHKILHDMDEPYKEVFTLRVFGELEFSQIAKLFGKSESWAKMTYYRGKSKIVSRLEENR